MSKLRSRALSRCCAGSPSDLSDVTLDISGISAFNAAFTSSPAAFRAAKPAPMARSPRSLRASGAAHSVAQAIARNPFMIIVPCHRVLEAGNYCRQDFAQWRRHLQAPPAVDRGRAQLEQQDPVRRAASRLPRRARRAKIAGMNVTTLLQRPSISVSDFRCSAVPGRHAVRGTAPLPLHLLCAQGQLRLPQPRPLLRAGGGIGPGRLIPATNMSAATIMSAATNACRFSWTPELVETIGERRSRSGRSAARRRCPN